MFFYPEFEGWRKLIRRVLPLQQKLTALGHWFYTKTVPEIGLCPSPPRLMRGIGKPV
jgi:hypothetical protein